ncbi:uncharacterized protein [Halyomorpha halys]|uniref:uncharacterized protein isoform X2 n=1 Tax=Halyomorpha halys TaxID=286706 RepID=UPI0034D1BA83
MRKMTPADTGLKYEISSHSNVSPSSQEQLSEVDKDRMLKENIQEVLEEVQAKVSEFTSKRHNVESINDSSSDSDIAEEGNEEIDLETCSARAYIEHTVGLILMNGLTILERERPILPNHDWGSKFFIDWDHHSMKKVNVPGRIRTGTTNRHQIDQKIQ